MDATRLFPGGAVRPTERGREPLRPRPFGARAAPSRKSNRRLPDEAYGARDSVLADKHVGLDAAPRGLGADGHPEGGERRARQLDAHDVPLLVLRVLTGGREPDAGGRSL